MKYRFVGDVHGQFDVLTLALDTDAERIIFVGDIVDSYTRSVEDQIRCVELLLDLTEKANTNVECLLGNHEWSYLDPDQQCSGWKAATQAHFIHLAERVRKAFKPFILVKQDFLVTHAGLTRAMWRDHKLSLENLEETLSVWSRDTKSPFFQVGCYRGGTAPYGGPLWCDFREEFESIRELTQVFGHTRGKGFRKRENATCIDTLENTAPQFLDMEI